MAGQDLIVEYEGLDQLCNLQDSDCVLPGCVFPFNWIISEVDTSVASTKPPVTHNWSLNPEITALAANALGMDKWNTPSNSGLPIMKHSEW